MDGIVNGGLVPHREVVGNGVQGGGAKGKREDENVLRVMAKAMAFWAPGAKTKLAECFGINRVVPKPAVATLQVQIEAIDPTRTSLSTPADSEPPRKMARKSPGGVVEGGAEAVVVGGGDREKVRAQALKVIAKAMVFWAPEGKRALAACLGINPTREQQPTPETLKVHIEAIGSGKVLIERLDIRLDDSRSMYKIIRQALIDKNLLDSKGHCYFCKGGTGGEKCKLDVKPARFQAEGPINLEMLSLQDSPDKKATLAAVKENAWVLEYADELKEDKDVVYAEIRRDGKALQYAADELKADRDVVLTAIREDGEALEFAAPELKADKDFILDVVSQNGLDLEFAAPELKADKDVVLAAVSNYGRALEYAAEELKADKDVVLAAVSNYGRALEFAAPELKADREVVLAAVRQNGCALQYAAAELKADRDVVLAAIRKNGWGLGFAAAELQADPEIRAAAGWE